MLLPNKLFSFDESALSKFPLVLSILRKSPMSVSRLYLEIENRVSGGSEYIEILDCLYALGKISYDDEKGVLRYVI